MIYIKLKELAAKMDKSISDIARETGLNRNTITALFHNKVDGIKFDTLDKLCRTYNIGINDIITIGTKQLGPRELSIIPDHPYKQEGELQPFTSWGWMLLSNRKPIHYFTYNLGKLSCYFKKDYGIAYWDKEFLRRCAESMYDNFQDKNKLERLYSDFLIKADSLENLYKRVNEEQVISYDSETLIDFFNTVWSLYEPFWQHSIFIDSFDSGVDQEKIKNIAEKYKLTLDDINTLTTPQEMTFDNERLFNFLSIIKTIINKKFDKRAVKKFVDESPLVAQYIKNFDYYKSNYVHIKHIERKELVQEINKYIKNKNEFKSSYSKLDNYSKIQKEAVKKVLKRHKLKTNPLWFFQKITFWREHRKKVNLMGIHVLDMILNSIEKKTGIPKRYLGFLSIDEIENVLKGLITKETLQKRYEKGILISVIGDDYKMIEGNEAISLKEEIENKIIDEHKDNIIVGQVASQGYAKGVARIVLGQEHFNKLKENEILVTGMTRPEFVPVMKKAAAIVTNEGGITCHAAIVSRELGKPCIIGTQKATKLINDGDLIEVRAHHGTVRVLKRKKLLK